MFFMWMDIIENLIMMLGNNIHYLIGIGWVIIRFESVWKYEGDIIVYILAMRDKEENIIIRKYRNYIILKILQILYEGFIISTLLGSYNNIEIVIGNKNNCNGDYI